ncbi:MAG: hypothetical protein Q8K24_09870 [Hydrogenophaga sp.]|nr:hypothetical protein [Hydrogenophaga sp.]
MKYAKTLLAVAAAAITTVAVAAVTYTPFPVSIGFVGKGDVQLITGWNNQQLQLNAPGVQFVESVTENYSAVCSWVTGEGTRGEKPHNVSHTRDTAVNASIAKELRRNSGTNEAVTGFNLTGPGSSVTTSGSVPVVNSPCMGNEGHDGTWSSVTLTSSTGQLLIVGYPVPLQSW